MASLLVVVTPPPTSSGSHLAGRRSLDSLSCLKPALVSHLESVPPCLNPILLARSTSCQRVRISATNGSQEEASDHQTAQDEEEEEVKSVGVRAALSMLKFYKREISPVLPSSCRYVPTCSEYSMEAYKRYGVAKGTILTAWRLCRCNPLGGSGYDPPRWFGEENTSDKPHGE